MAFAEDLKLRIKKKAHFCCCLCHALGTIEIHHSPNQKSIGAALGSLLSIPDTRVACLLGKPHDCSGACSIQWVPCRAWPCCITLTLESAFIKEHYNQNLHIKKDFYSVFIGRVENETAAGVTDIDMTKQMAEHPIVV